MIRFHTRVPIVEPGLIDAGLVAALETGKALYVVVHANHPRELTAAAKAAAGRLLRAGIPLLGQSVLLKGVNDDAATLTALLRGLVAMRIKPYYLHHADLARGTAHLRAQLGEGQGAGAGLARPGFGPVPAGLCPRPPGRARQGAGWAQFRNGKIHRRVGGGGPQRAGSRLPAEAGGGWVRNFLSFRVKR